MVTFVCSNCNTSLKKNQVPFHGCNGKFACITCNNDFNKTTFKTHDLCISEAEKYQGSDFKPKNNKGEARQGNWNDSVLKALNEYQTKDASLILLIRQLKNKTNIPQKKDKFKNFINSLPSSKSVIDCHEKIWAIISPLKTVPNVPEAPLAKEVIENVNLEKTDENANKDKKKRKNADSNDNESDNKRAKLDDTNEDRTGDVKPKKSKKVKESTETSENGKEAKKDKIKKKNDDVETMEVDEPMEIVAADEKKDKKKKKKSKSVEEINIVEEVAPVETKKEKKKKKSKTDQVETVVAEVVKDDSVEAASDKKDKKKKKKEKQVME